MVALQLPTGATEAEYDVGCSWEELADKQAAGSCGDLTIESAEEWRLRFAMQDRLAMKSNGESVDFGRRIFVLFDAEIASAIICDEKGALVDEPQHGVHAGKMPISEFKSEWTEGFFCIAEVMARLDDDDGWELSSGRLYSDGQVDEGTRLLMKFDTGVW